VSCLGIAQQEIPDLTQRLEKVLKIHTLSDLRRIFRASFVHLHISDPSSNALAMNEEEERS
jgi:hypothetical protein